MVIGRKLLLVIVLLLSIIISSVPAVAEEQTDCLVYFYGNNCLDCPKASAHLQSLKIRYPQLQIKELEVHSNLANLRTLDNYFKSYKIPESSQGVPAVFMPGSYFIGSSAIIDMLENRILDNSLEACPAIEGEKAVGLVGFKEPHDVLDTFTFAMVSKAAVKDAFRPGMLAFMLLLLVMLTSLRKKENVLQRGILAVLSLTVVLLLFGLGLLFKAPAWVTRAAGVAAIISSLFRIKGFFKTWKIVFEGISERTEQAMINYIKYLFTPVGFVLVSIIAALLTTGEISEILSLLRMLALESKYNFKLFSYLFYHTIIMIILPSVIVAILYQLSGKLDQQALKKEPYHDAKAEKWRGHTQNVLRFAVSSIMLIIGFVLLFA